LAEFEAALAKAKAAGIIPIMAGDKDGVVNFAVQAMINIYYGFDPREEVGSHTFCSSVINRSSWPVALIPLHLDLFAAFYRAGQRDGTNAFIYTRFLIPFLQDFK
jgi:hypothetical protein